MTCMISSPWQPFSLSYGWSSVMNRAESTTLIPADFGHQQQYGNVVSESESTPSSSSGKKRPSRAGTRSVSTLSVAQLERKRANDREAQRAIRQRTKDHIDSLEKDISDLRAANDRSEKLFDAAKRRNIELAEENGYLRNKLREAGIPFNVPSIENQDPPEPTQLSVRSASPATQASGSSIQPADSTSTPRSTLSIATSQSSDSRQGSWQQPQSAFVQSAPPNLQATSPVQMEPGLSQWRSHDGSQNYHATPNQVPATPQSQPHPQYASQNATWAATPPPYPYHAQQAPQQHQQQYAQPLEQMYSDQTTPQQANFPIAPPPPPPPQAEFQGMSVSTPIAYQHATFPQPPQYPMGPAQVSTGPNSDVTPQTVQMQPAPFPSPMYHQSPGGHQYPQQPMNQAMPFREQPSGHSYPVPHYPNG